MLAAEGNPAAVERERLTVAGLLARVKRIDPTAPPAWRTPDQLWACGKCPTPSYFVAWEEVYAHYCAHHPAEARDTFEHDASRDVWVNVARTVAFGPKKAIEALVEHLDTVQGEIKRPVDYPDEAALAARLPRLGTSRVSLALFALEDGLAIVAPRIINEGA